MQMCKDSMIEIEDVVPGESYTCKFRVETMLDTYSRVPGLSDTPVKGVGVYEGVGVLVAIDVKSRLVDLQDVVSKKMFVVGFDDIWDITTSGELTIH